MADRHETVLPPDPEDVTRDLDAALAVEGTGARDAVSEVVAAHPSRPAGWAALAGLGRDPIERYAAARVGYHRGLDALRAAGWGGKGYVRFEQPGNRPFLRCVARLRVAAAEIGEVDEVERLGEFLEFLDPDWDDAWVDAAAR